MTPIARVASARSFVESPRIQSRLFAVVCLATVALSVSSASAQTPPGSTDPANANNRRRGGNGTDNAGDRRNFSPQDAQARMLAAMRERLEVPDDEEWKVISDRITKVMELRRSSAAGGFMGFGRAGQGNAPDTTGGRGGRGGGSPEMSALQMAVRDKLPDAEIKSRLDRVRETRKDNESKLAKAQDELRAVLSIRQEAMAVVAGLLP